MAIEVKLVEWFDEHHYKIKLSDQDTRLFPSVTTKLGIVDKPFLARWRGDIGNREADLRVYESQQKGSRIHYAWSVLCNGGAVLYNPWQHPNYTEEEISELKKENRLFAILQNQDEMLAVIKLQKLVDVLKPTMMFSERIVYSIQNEDAGTVDNGWFIKGGKYIINGAKPVELVEGNYILDLKTGNQVSDEAFYQVAAYAKCAEEMGDKPYVGTIIIHTNAKTKSGIEGLACHVSGRQELEENYSTYRVISDLWKRKNPDFAPRVFEFPSLVQLKTNG